MNEQMRKQLSTYKRNLENKRIQGLIFSFLLVFTIIVFDLIGVYSLVKVTGRRLQTLSDLNELNADLETKSKNIDTLKAKLNESKFYLSMLEVAVPKERKIENYMMDLVGAAAGNGIKQKKMQTKHLEDEYVELRASFQGPPFQIYPFIQSIEAIDRLSVVKEFTYSLEGATAHIQVTLKAFYLER